VPRNPPHRSSYHSQAPHGVDRPRSTSKCHHWELKKPSRSGGDPLAAGGPASGPCQRSPPLHVVARPGGHRLPSQRSPTCSPAGARQAASDPARSVPPYWIGRSRCWRILLGPLPSASGPTCCSRGLLPNGPREIYRHRPDTHGQQATDSRPCRLAATPPASTKWRAKATAGELWSRHATTGLRRTKGTPVMEKYLTASDPPGNEGSGSGFGSTTGMTSAL